MDVNINLEYINDVCNNKAIGLEQMGYIYPRVMSLINEDNQETVVDAIVEIYEYTQCCEKTISLLKDRV